MSLTGKLRRASWVEAASSTLIDRRSTAFYEIPLGLAFWSWIRPRCKWSKLMQGRMHIAAYYPKPRVDHNQVTCKCIGKPNLRYLHEVQAITRGVLLSRICHCTGSRAISDHIFVSASASQRPTRTPFAGLITISHLQIISPSFQYLSILSNLCRILTTVYPISVKANCCPIQMRGPPLKGI